MEALIFILSGVIAYLIGSFPTSYIIAKYLKGIDIRSAGSGNAGATNVLRVVGKAPALITLLVDILKGVLAVAAIAPLSYIFLEKAMRKDFYFGFIALMAVAGHIWPVFLKFKGGKGVATMIGVGIASLPVSLILSLIVWLFVFMPTGYVSLASITAMLSFPIAVAAVDYSFYAVIFSVTICAIGIYKHSGNIKRLIKREEHKTVIFGKK